MNQIQEKLALLSNKLGNSILKRRFESIVFLDRDFSHTVKNFYGTKKSKPNSKQCIILSPSLYWVRKKELPNIKNIFSAQKISKAIFDDLDNSNLIIKVTKAFGSTYYFFAIDKNIVENSIKKHLGIDSCEGQFCTSQHFFAGITKPVEINETHSLISIDGTVEKIPSVYLSDRPSINIQESIKSISSNSFDTFSLSFGQKETTSKISFDTTGYASKLVAAALILLSISWIAESALYLKKTSNITEKIEQLKETYKLPATSIETESVISRAKGIETSQNTIREITKAINSLALPKEQTLESVQISPTAVMFSIKTTNTESIKSALSKNMKIASVVQNGDVATFKVMLK